MGSGYSKTEVIEHRDQSGKLIGYGMLTMTFDQEDDQWVGICLETGTSAYDTQLKEAEAQLKDAVALQLMEMERLGFIEEYLSAHHVHYVPARSWDSDIWTFSSTGTR